MKKIICFLYFFICLQFLHAQTETSSKQSVFQVKIDSLENLLDKKSGKEKVDLLYEVAWEYKYLSPQKSLEYGEQGLTLAESLKYRKGEADLRKVIGACHYISGDYKHAIEYLDSALKIYNEICDKKGTASSLNNIGLIYYYLSDYENALNFHKQSLNFCEEIDDKQGIARSLNNIGLVYNNLSDNDKALDCYYQSLQLSEEIDDKDLIARSLNNIGIIYRQLSDFDKSLEYYHQSYRIKKEFGDKAGAASSLNNIGSVYYNLYDYDNALVYYHQALKISEEIGYKNIIGTCLINIGLINVKLIKYDEALECSRKSLEIRKETGDRNGVSISLLNIGHIYIELRDYKHARQYLNESLQTAREIGAKEIIKNCYKELSRLHQAEGNCKTALEYHHLYVMLKDSIYSTESMHKIASLEKSYEIQKKQNEIELLKKDQAIRDLNLKRQKAISHSFISGFVLVFLTGAVVYKLYRSKTRAHGEISVQKDLLEDQSRQLREMDKIKSRFFANISHEFRTPLTLIMGPLQKLLSETKDGSLKHQFQMMLNQAKHQLNLVNQLLDLSKIEKGKLKLQAGQGHLNRFVRMVVSAFESRAEEKQIQLTVTEKEKDIHLFFDRDKLQTILANLLSNAFKFTPSGGEVEVSVSSIESQPVGGENREAVITVRDTGSGMPAEELPHIFDRFYQADSSETREYEGTGIGLALAKELAELHHGRIEAKSEPGKGAAFIIHLPLGKDHLAEDEILCHTIAGAKHSDEDPDNRIDIINQNASPLQKTVSKNAPKILIVEDNRDMRRYIKENLSSSYQIIEAANGKEGLDMAFRRIPDLIVSDVMMPEMDGFELTRIIGEDIRTNHVPVILVTAKADEESKLKGIQNGADHFILKPFNLQELMIRIEKLIEQRCKLREKFAKHLFLDNEEIKATSLEENFLKRVTEVIEKNINNEIFSVEILAKEIGMSRMNLFRKLKTISNYTPNQLIRLIRLKRARQLLKNKAGTINEIMYQVGFTHISYFAKCFKEYFGILPSEYGNLFNEINT